MADEPQARTRRPNVILILADDLGWGDIGCFGQTKIPTPHLDALAQRGMRLTQHYSGAPVCAPSRCVLMTGKHLGHAEIRGNQQAKVKFPQFAEGQHPLSSSAFTLAEYFKQLGYRTAAFGKWGLGPVGSTGDPNAQGFELFFGYNCQAVAHSYYPAHLWRNAEKIALNQRPIPGHQKRLDGEIKLEDWLGEQYAPERMMEEAERFLEQQGAEPFFLYLPFIEPHVAMHPPKSSVERFPVEWDTVAYRGQCGYLPHPRPRAAYAAMVSDLDSYVGRILRIVQEKKLDESTLIVFTSDNGATHPHAGDPNFHVGGADATFFQSTAGLKGYKGSLYEGGIRVPTIVSWSGVIPAGTSNSHPSYFADWFPTLQEAIEGVKPGEPTNARFDGESFWQTILANKAGRRSRPMLWVFPEYSGQVAVRLGDYKVLQQGLKTKQPKGWEVYDLARDSSETHNIADRHPELITQALEILLRETAANEIFPVKIPAK
jgi:arylsulfatase A-like enzyme